MDQVRKLHNKFKNDLIASWVRPRDSVLDCGCGRGGDWWKWKGVGARVFAIDPDTESLKEAEQRARDMKMDIFFLGKGTIVQAAFAGPYNVVCYNFSLHYIFDTPEIFEKSIKALGIAVKPGGYLIGITPDLSLIMKMVNNYNHYEDSLGNKVILFQGGRRAIVNLVDGPFYAEGGREEPTLDPDVLISALESVGFEKILWEPMLPKPNGLISDMYSKFVFRKI